MLNLVNKKIKKASVPDTFSTKGFQFKVTAIADKAFANCKN